MHGPAQQRLFASSSTVRRRLIACASAYAAAHAETNATAYAETDAEAYAATGTAAAETDAATYTAAANRQADAATALATNTTTDCTPDATAHAEADTVVRAADCTAYTTTALATDAAADCTTNATAYAETDTYAAAYAETAVGRATVVGRSDRQHCLGVHHLPPCCYRPGPATPRSGCVRDHKVLSREIHLVRVRHVPPSVDYPKCDGNRLHQPEQHSAYGIVVTKQSELDQNRACGTIPRGLCPSGLLEFTSATDVQNSK